MKSNFQSESSDQQKLMKDLWSHAVATAITARKLASATNGDPEQAYLAGLLHDMGKLLILRAVDHCAASGGSLDLTPIVLNELLEMMHAEVGHRMLTEWQLPEAVCQAALQHHHDAESLEDQLTVRVQAANLISRKIGAHPNPDPDLNLEDLTAIDRLNMGEVELAALMIDVEDEYEKIRQML
jgi:putative nucleotidyltransferase with HDIG domain